MKSNDSLFGDFPIERSVLGIPDTLFTFSIHGIATIKSAAYGRGHFKEKGQSVIVSVSRIRGGYTCCIQIEEITRYFHPPPPPSRRCMIKSSLRCFKTVTTVGETFSAERTWNQWTFPVRLSTCVLYLSPMRLYVNPFRKCHTPLCASLICLFTKAFSTLTLLRL